MTTLHPDGDGVGVGGPPFLHGVREPAGARQDVDEVRTRHHLHRRIRLVAHRLPGEALDLVEVPRTLGDDPLCGRRHPPQLLIVEQVG
ncbi:hypothetical protein G7070_01385 [Propioniciclava coleopterorum]|uniref:Uncharacterized protein n=1 Tax=Propioniciclava coleopterorum TaxID=2714937 RepID=A0A6G7Y2S3_9ACTN|nr:hypothetical protein [Propioniciclava coleopterorum]QIK71184.1 hypothetical protein G7070_01385 [Propioniciclava coleopterorum]